MNGKRQLRIILAVIVARTAVAAPAGVADAPPAGPAVCVSANNTYAIPPETSPSTIELNELLASINTLDQNLTAAKSEVFESTVAGEAPNANTLAAEFQQGRTGLAKAFNTISTHSQILVIRQIVDTYIDAATEFLSIQFYLHPYALRQFQQAESRVEFSVPFPLWVELNMTAPVALTAVLSSNAKTVTVGLSREVIYARLTGAAARSDVTRENGQANFAAIHCVLASKLIEQYFLQETTRGVPPGKIGLALPASTPACLGLPISEVEDLFRDRAEEKLEGQIRLQLLAATVTADQVLPDAMKAFTARYPNLTTADVTNLIINPVYVFSGPDYLTSHPPLALADAQNLDTWLTQATAKAAEAAPYYAPLMTMTASPQFASILQSIVSSCADPQTQQQAEANPADMNRRLSLVEKTLGLQLSSFMNFYVGHIENLDMQSAAQALRQMLIYKKYLDAVIIVAQFYALELASNVTPQQVALSVSDALYQLASQTVDQALAQKPVQDWFNGILQRLAQLKREPPNQGQLAQIEQNNFYDAIIGQSAKAAKWRDPKTPANEIPFNGILLATDTPQANQIANAGGPEVALIQRLFKQQSFEGQKEVWKSIQAELFQYDSRHGMVCQSATDQGFAQAAGMALKRLVRLSPKVDEQCVQMNDIAAMMGLYLPKKPATLQDIMPTLKEILSAKQLASTIALYKADLDKVDLRDFRFLMLRAAANQNEKKALDVYQVIGESSARPYQVQLIQWALGYADYQLQLVAKKYLVATKMSDFDGLIESGAVNLPNLLIDQPPAVQATLAAEQDYVMRTWGIGSQIYDSYMHDLNEAFVVFTYYWLARLALPLVARWGALRALPTLMGRVDLRLAPVINNLFAPIWMNVAYTPDLLIQSLRIHRNNMDIAAINELYWSQGLNTTSTSTLSTDASRRVAISTLQEANSHDESQIHQDILVIAVSAAFSAGGAVYAKSLKASASEPGRFRRMIEYVARTGGYRARVLRKALISGDRDAILNAEDGIANMAVRDRGVLAGAEQALGQPVNLRYQTLKDSLRAIQNSKTSSATQIYDAEQAFKTIVSKIGGRAQQLSAQLRQFGDRGLQIYARSMFGGSSADLLEYQHHYVEVSKLAPGAPP